MGDAAPGRARGFIRGYVAGLRWLYDRKNKAAAIELFQANLPKISPEVAAKSYDILLAPKGGFARKAEIDTKGVREVLALRSEYGEPKKQLSDPGKYIDLAYYKKAMAK